MTFHFHANLLALLEQGAAGLYKNGALRDLKRLSRRMRKNLFWHYSSNVVWAAMYYLDKEMVDGVICCLWLCRMP